MVTILNQVIHLECTNEIKAATHDVPKGDNREVGMRMNDAHKI